MRSTYSTGARAALLAAVAVLVAGLCDVGRPEAADAHRPHVLWIVVDDMSPDFGCCGQHAVPTPHVDRLAREGTRFSRCYVTAPVCSPCRSALITGMYQTTIGAHHHRSGRGTERIALPAGVRPVPELFRAAGYWTCIGDGLPAAEEQRGRRGAAAQLGKTDYNFVWDEAMYDGEDWAGRRAGQPFFMQIMLPGGKLRDGPNGLVQVTAAAVREFGSATRPEDVTLPPYLPRDPALLADQAAYLDAVRLTDAHVGRVLARLEAEGILDETLVIFMTDHGISHVRAKQFLYDAGTHVPLVVRGPRHSSGSGVPRGAVRDDLVEHIDVAAVSLVAAGLPLPAMMQGRDVLAADYRPRDAVFAARDRCDETVDRIRSVRTDRYLYIRNFHPDRPHLQPNVYKDHKPTVIALRRLHEAGRLEPLAEWLLFAPTRPREELYRYGEDPWQLENLAADPSLATVLEEHRRRLDRWMTETGDPGPEPAAMYDSDMRVYLGSGKRGAGNSELEANIATMKRWAAAGR
jgi:arylsulfatase A-like enzyme